MSVVTVRELPRADWDRLCPDNADLVSVLSRTRSSNVRVMIAEEGGAIIGCWALLSFLQLEGLWVHPAQRGRSVGWRMLRLMKRWIRDLGATGAMTASIDPAIDGYLTRIGARPLPGRHYFLSVPEEVVCQPPS